MFKKLFSCLMNIKKLEIRLMPYKPYKKLWKIIKIGNKMIMKILLQKRF